MSDTRRYLGESIEALQAFAHDTRALDTLTGMADDICGALRAGGKLLLAGNGGSAADAQHIATELVCRLVTDRAPLAAIALTTDSSILTAAANDYGYEKVFARQVRALGRPGDIFLGISTSGRSPNVLRALDAARETGIATFGFAGATAPDMAARCDRLLLVPAGATAIIQQLHITAGHVICLLVERAMFPEATRPSA